MIEQRQRPGVDRRSVLRAMGAGAALSGVGLGGDGGQDLAALLAAEPGKTDMDLARARNGWFGGREFVQNEQCAYPTGGGLVGQAHDFELYGPTDVNAQTSNGALAVGINDEGTVTVFRWPRPSFYDQLKYKTSDRDAPESGTEHGKFGAYPNAGAFLGLLVDDGEGPDLHWLRESRWDVTQAYTDEDGDPEDLTDTVRTEFRHDQLGLTVVVRDVATRGATTPAGEVGDGGDDALVRDVTVRRDADSPVDSAELVAFENLNLVVSKKPKSPTRDWCEEESNRDHARYDPAVDAIVHETAGVDASTGESRSVAVAMGFAGDSSGHQVGGDAYEPTAGPAGRGGPTQDAYDDLRDGQLRGNDEFVGQTTGAMTAALAFGAANGTDALPDDAAPAAGAATDGAADAGGDGEADVARERVLFAAGETAAAAAETLGTYRERSFAEVDREKRAWIEGLLDDPPLPDAEAIPEGKRDAVLALSKRALVSLVTSYDPVSGAVVASISTQSPYGEDWVRDGAYFNYGLGLAGLGEWIGKRNRWYAEIQQSEANPHPSYPDTPRGNWPMNHYADGVAGGPIDWEIDETGYGVWTIVDHYELTGDEAYLEDVYPAIERSAEFLTEYRDDRNGLQAPASEDDHPEPSQTIVGAATVWLGLDSAVTAAEALGRADDAEAWRARRDELRAAIEELLYQPPTDGRSGYYGKKKGSAMAPLAWPVCYDDFDTDRMQNHLLSSWRGVAPSFEEPTDGGLQSGLYEAKGLVPLAQATRDGPVSPPGVEGEVTSADVKAGIDWIANRHATPDTHIMGEIWIQRGEEVKTTISQPHIWEQILFYLAAMEAYPPTDEYDLDLSASCGGVIDQLRRAETLSADAPSDDPTGVGAGASGDAGGSRGGEGGSGDGRGDEGGDEDSGFEFPFPIPDIF